VTAEQIRLVQDSWRQLHGTVQPAAPRVAGLFYSRLFALDPSVRPLFKSGLQEQGRKLMAMISMAVGALTRLDTIVPAVQDLGRRHAGYGVEDRHYTVVGAALVWTLEQELNHHFTAEVEQAWRAAYHVLATTMKQAAASEENA
jgi:hemoglobin-like flavoprotein